LKTTKREKEQVPPQALIDVHVGVLQDPQQFALSCARLIPKANFEGEWALCAHLPIDVTKRFASGNDITAELVWLKSKRRVNYIVLALQCGGLQLRAFASLSEPRISDWMRSVHRFKIVNIAVELDEAQELVLIRADCTSAPHDDFDQLARRSRELSRAEGLRDYAAVLRNMLRPTKLRLVLPLPTDGLHLICIESGAAGSGLAKAFTHSLR
jgi:hypothetical protein